MAVHRYDKNRDARFDDWRRNDVPKGGKLITLPIHSTDIDSLEFLQDAYGVHLVALIEKKLNLSQWKSSWRGAQIAQFQLAQRAEIPYYVVEHTKDCSHWRVYHITTIDRRPCDDDVVLDGTLFDYTEFLCKLRGYTMPPIFEDAIKSVAGITEDGESISAYSVNYITS